METKLPPLRKIVELNNLPEVTSPFTYDREGRPHTEGLYSTEIFGFMGSDQRQTQFAYINLKRKFLHPLVFKAIISSYKFTGDIMMGLTDGNINKNGMIESVESGKGIGTGIDFFINNWKKIKWDVSSKARADKAELFTLIPELDRIFTDVWLVVPPFYRDMSTGKQGGASSKDEFTKLYGQLINSCNLAEAGDMFAGKMTEFRIQNLLLTIHTEFMQQLAGKKGVIHRKALGKAIDYPARTVISAPPVECEDPDQQQIPYGYLGIPLHIAAAMFYPFVKVQIHELFFNQFKQYSVYVTDKKGVTVIDEEQIAALSDEFIDKLVKRYARSLESRLDRIMLKDIDGKEVPLQAFEDKLGRPFTLTDLLYIATFKATLGKHTVTTRYPLEDYRNILRAKVKILVTEKTEFVNLLGMEDKQYPVIPKELDYKKVHWIESVRCNNLYLDGFGGDFDGDMVTHKGIFTQEANEELDNLEHSISHYVDPAGESTRIVEKELIQTVFNFSRRY